MLCKPKIVYKEVGECKDLEGDKHLLQVPLPQVFKKKMARNKIKKVNLEK